ncbi:MAG: hypothetical protein WD063_19730 [Pirellulales bacterium]
MPNDPPGPKDLLLGLNLARRFREIEPEPLISIRPKGGLRVSLSGRAEPAYARQSVNP